MLRHRITICCLIGALGLFSSSKVHSQCTSANINWDNLDFISTQINANYATYINTTAEVDNMVRTQRFAIGTNRVVISATHPSSGILGENTTHTGDAGSFGSGADISFSGNGTITLTFDTAVSNVRFSIYDLDNSQVVTVTAAEGIIPRIPTLTKPASGDVTILANVGTGASGNRGNTVNQSTLNVAVTGPVTTVTLAFSGSSGDFWISDIQACVYRNFPNNYYTISEPFTGQPAYVLVVHDLNTVYMLDPASGRAVSLFTDPDPRVREINNLAYDPYKRIVYYSVDGLERCTPAGLPDSIRHIKKYDVDAETISTLLSDVNLAPFYVPTYHSGLESGGASFYNGSLYIGVEAYFLTGTRNSARETAIWRIDFDTDSLTPTKASQVWAITVDNGTNNVHDYADFVMKDGVLYNYNSSLSAPGGRGLYYHINMQTGVTTTTVSPSSSANRPAQAAQSWNGTVYWVGNQIGTYNGTVSNTVTGKQTIYSAPRSVSWVGPAGDAAEAFRPKADFGDAPASYDPVATSPAMHERDSALFLGQTFLSDWDWEWNKQTSSDATGDGGDDNDGLSYTSILDPSYGNYLVQARVYNNTGVDATLIAWLDYNGNGVYDASEALTPITVSSSSAVQNVNLFWPSISTSLSAGSFTFLRIRLTTSSISSANPTGFMADGEVEDYRVLVDDFPLTVNLLSFDAKALNTHTARLTWSTTNEKDFSGFGIERSTDGVTWSNIGFVNAKGNNAGNSNNLYIFTDERAPSGNVYYRLKLTDQNAIFRFSETRQVFIKDVIDDILLVPNPAKNNTTVQVSSALRSDATLVLVDMQGRRILSRKTTLNAGRNSISLDNLSSLPPGTYMVQIITGTKTVSKKLIIQQ